MEKNRGITLVALVVTIIVVLILVGVSISALTGEEGLFAKANKASDKYITEARNEAERFNLLLVQTKPVPNLTESNVKFKCTPDQWTNLTNEDGVKVEISTKEIGQYYTLQYSLDEGANWTNYTTPIKVTKNGQAILARLSEKSRSGGVASYHVLNIDTVAPKEFDITTSEIGETSFKINANTEDGEVTDISGKSGIKEYKYYIKTSTETQYIETTSTPQNLAAGETYSIYVEAYDNAGNKTTSNTIEQRTLTAVPNLIKGSNVTFVLDPDTNINPTKYGRGVNVTITENTQSGYTLQYTLESDGTGWDDYTGTIEVKAYNTVITARLYDKSTEREGSYATTTVLNIDILPPNEFNLMATAEPTSITVSASGTVTDANATSTSAKSEIVKYEYKLDSGSWVTPTTATSTSYTFTGLTAGTSHTVSMRAIDTAGNVREATNKNYSISTTLPNGSWDTIAKVNSPDVSKLPTVTTKYITWTGTGTFEEKIWDNPPANWYDYDNGQWANIKTTSTDKSLEAYWVWIPRFAYKLPENGSTPKQIDVIFVQGIGKIGADNQTCYYSTDIEITKNGTGNFKDKTTTAASNWIIHPAFTFGDTQLPGIWVAKYKASSSTPNATDGGGNSNSLKVQSKPNTIIWRSNKLSNTFTVCRAMQNTGGAIGTQTGTTTIDSHPMKSLEYGAMAALGQSKYGVYNPTSSTGQNGTKTYKAATNNSSTYLSGYSGTSVAYNTGVGPQASTTGTVYGVYDVSVYYITEYVMGVMETSNGSKTPATASTGFSSWPDAKYFDLYIYNSDWRSYGNSKIGDMISELYPYYRDYGHWGYGYAWGPSYAQNIQPSGSYYIYTRGGSHQYVGVGIFGFLSYTGDGNNSYGKSSFRPVLVSL